MISFLCAGVVALGVARGPVQACSFHSYIPEETTVDRLLGSEHVVLARPVPGDPFRYEAVEAIRGSVDGVDIPFVVDSRWRPRLTANPGDAVLFARDGAYGPWQRLAYVDAAYRPVLDQIVARLEAWSVGDDRDRFQFFADLLGHPDAAIQALVLAELDRAPYPLLSSLRLEVDAGALMDGIWAPDNIGTLPIRVLLLGLSGDAAARDFLTARFADGVMPSGGQAGAFAVALIESTGVAGVETVADLLRKRRDLDEDTRETLVSALAIQSGTGTEEVRRVVQDRVSALLWADPTLAGPVARQFGQRGDWSQYDALHEVARMGAVPTKADLINVSQYLSIAKEVQGE